MIRLTDLNGARVALLGLGRSGRAALAALRAAGAQVTAWDDQQNLSKSGDYRNLATLDWAQERFEQLVIAPGVPHRYPTPHPAAALARKQGVPIIGDIELLMRARPKARLIGVSGTNGKSTLVALIGHILQQAGVKLALGGNFGPASLALDDPGAEGLILLELSSYQLETTPSLALDFALMTNITPDHLSRHGGWAGYLAAKDRLFAPRHTEALAIVARGSAGVEQLLTTRQSRLHRWSNKLLISPDSPLPFALTAPRLAGAHNRSNALLAIALAKALGLDEALIADAIASYPGLAHRQEWVGETAQWRFINDSKATNLEATLWALRAYPDAVWLAGGQAKAGEDWSQLATAAAQLNGIELFGQDAAEIAAALQNARLSCRVHRQLDEAFNAALNAHPGGTLLLSPACASFDQFENFEARGEAFRTLVTAQLAPPLNPPAEALQP